MHPAYEFAADEVYVTTPALEIAAPGGRPRCRWASLSCCWLRSCGSPRRRLAHVAGALALVAALAGLIVLLAPALKPLGNLNLLIFFVGLVGG